MKKVKVKINIKNLIYYLIAVAAFAGLFIFNHRQALFICMVCMICLIIPGIIMAIRPDFCPLVSFSMSENGGLIGEKVQLITTINNPFFIPYTRIHVDYSFSHSLEKLERSYENVYPSFKGKKAYKENIIFDYCGIYNISASKIRIYDWIKVFYYEYLELPKTQAIVMPNTYNLDALVHRLSLKDEESVKDDPLAGIDVSEVKELREYKEGDRLSQVHWKLSTKSEDLIVKEYDKTAGTCIVIGLDGSYESLKDINAYYSFFYSLSKKLIEEEMYFDIIYFDDKASDTKSAHITNTYDLNIAIQNMFFNIKSIDLYELDAYYKQMNFRSKLMFITTKEVDEVEYVTFAGKDKIKLVASL